MPLPSASQTVGPFFFYALHKPGWNDLARDGERTECVRIAGSVLDGDGIGIPEGLVEIWHPQAGFGRACTDEHGRYSFRTPRAPFLNVSVFARGLLKRVVTRIYFSDRADENARDPVFSSIREPEVRQTLLATLSDGVYRFDIRLQGAGETAFFAF